MSESMTTALHRTLQITAGAVWTLMMLGLGFAVGLFVAVAHMGAC